MATATETQTRASIERTEHPYIVRGTRGEPRVEGSRISVSQIFRLYEAGMSAPELVEDFPALSLAEVHDAISYAYDHMDEIEEHEARSTLRAVLRDNDMVFVNHRLIPRARLKPSDVPPGATVYT